MATNTSTNPTSSANGDARGPLSHTNAGTMPAPSPVNRKKQKRRQKQAARLAADPSDFHASAELDSTADEQHSNDHGETDSADLDHAGHNHSYRNGASDLQHDFGDHDDIAGSKSKKKKNKKGRSGSHTLPDGSSTPLSTPSATFSHPPPSHSLPYPSRFRAKSKDSSIWNQSSLEERENIRKFWFELGEEERRQLVKVEKDAVLKKMKEQQKHSCSCTVCGRKRTAIEEELEVLYDAYYEELEQYANNNQGNFDAAAPIIPPPRLYQPRLRSPGQHTHTHGQYHPSRSRVQELPEDDEEDDEVSEDDYDDEEEEEDDEEDEDDDEPYSDEEYEDEEARAARADFFAFGNSLTVKDGILTVADDLLKNDGKHFIDMMEQLAERRMQREEDTQYNIAAAHQSFHAGHNHGPLDDEDYDDEEEEEDYDSQEEEDYDDEEMDAMTEEQRMQEGRRMFQIFAARMFEQRVMTAYREKVAEQRQKQLIEELLEEENLNEQRNAKKAREAQKKKDKKRQQKQAKEEEKARRDAEKAAEEAAAKAAQQKKLEEQRLKREEQRKKRDAERKAQEEERTRKEAEKQRRLKEERERQAEAERKLREQKEEKKRREEAKRKEKEEREKKAKEEQERKSREEQARKEREAAAKAELEVRDRAQTKAAPTPGTISMPSSHLSQASSGSFNSPLYTAATPIVPKVSTPARPRQPSHQESHTSSPHSQPSSSEMVQMSPMPCLSPRSAANPPFSGPMAPRPGHQQQPPLHHPQPSAPLSPLGRTNHPGFPGFSALPSNPPGLPPMGGRPLGPPDMHMYSPNLNSFRGFPGPGGIPAPPGINGGVRPMPPGSGRGFPSELSQTIPFAGHHGMPGAFSMQQPGVAKPHSRQPSNSFERSPLESTGQSIPNTRPSPIKRPSSGNQDQQEGGHGTSRREVDELSTQLGSSALLDDNDAHYSSNLSQSLPGATAQGQFPVPSRASFQGSSLFADPLGPKPSTFNIGSPGFGGGAFSGAPFSRINTTWGATGKSAFEPLGLRTAADHEPYLTGGGWPQPNQPNNVFAAPAGHHRSHTSRPVSIRLLVIQACKYLNTLSPQTGSGGYHSVDIVLNQVDQLRPRMEAAIKLDEMMDIFDTEGNHQNGGGSFSIKEDETGRYVKFEPDTNSAATGHRGSIVPGDIGSPVPGNSHLAAFSGFSSGPSVLRQYSSPQAGLYGGTT